MRYDQAVNIEDLRAIAKRRLPRFVFDYLDGGAEDELTLRRNREAFRSASCRDTLVDVARRTVSTRLLGAPSALPVVVGPTGAQRPLLARRRPRACARRRGGRRAVRDVDGVDEPGRGHRARGSRSALAAGLCFRGARDH